MQFKLFGNVIDIKFTPKQIHEWEQEREAADQAKREARFQKKLERASEKFTHHAKLRIDQRLGAFEVYAVDCYNDIRENLVRATMKGDDLYIKGRLGYYLISPDGFCKTFTSTRPKGHVEVPASKEMIQIFRKAFRKKVVPAKTSATTNS